MYYLKLTLLLLAISLKLNASEGGLINPSFIQNELTHKANWANLHGAYQDDLGAGMLYYSLVYTSRAKLCVCLGSGDGFVPRVLRQAQRDLNLPEARTILVDGNQGCWGRPLWLQKNSFFRTNYPDIEIILESTATVADREAKEWQIDYLHIDADRTTKGAMQDFLNFLPHMSVEGIIILHDTAPGKPCSLAAKLIREMGYPTVDFPTFGTGVTIIQLDNRFSRSF